MTPGLALLLPGGGLPIDDRRRARIGAYLRVVAGRELAHFPTAGDVLRYERRAAREIERRGFTPIEAEGAEIVFRHGVPPTGSRYPRRGAYVLLRFTGGRWRLVEVESCEFHAAHGTAPTIRLTEAQKARLTQIGEARLAAARYVRTGENDLA